MPSSGIILTSTQSWNLPDCEVPPLVPGRSFPPAKCEHWKVLVVLLALRAHTVLSLAVSDMGPTQPSHVLVVLLALRAQTVLSVVTTKSSSITTGPTSKAQTKTSEWSKAVSSSQAEAEAGVEG